MKTFWRVSLVCLIWTCSGLATEVNATPYTFDETKQDFSSNTNSITERAPQYPIHNDAQSDSGLPPALRGADESREFESSRPEQTAANIPFMQEEGPGRREFMPTGASITSSPDYRFSSATQSQFIPAEEWYGNRIKGQGRHHHHRANNYNTSFGNNNFNNNNNAFVNNNPYNNYSSNNFTSNNFSGANFSGNNNFNNLRNNRRNRNRKNSDPTADTGIKQPDQVADNPQVDGDGVRHFSNGKHLDLSKMSLDEAIGATNLSTRDGRNGGGVRNAGNGGNGGNGGNQSTRNITTTVAPPLSVDNGIVTSPRNRHLPYHAIVDQPADRYIQPLNLLRRPARAGFGEGFTGSSSYSSP